MRTDVLISAVDESCCGIRTFADGSGRRGRVLAVGLGSAEHRTYRWPGGKRSCCGGGTSGIVNDVYFSYAYAWQTRTGCKVLETGSRKPTTRLDPTRRTTRKGCCFSAAESLWGQGPTFMA